jgi:hypothetical protein
MFASKVGTYLSEALVNIWPRVLVL